MAKKKEIQTFLIASNRSILYLGKVEALMKDSVFYKMNKAEVSHLVKRVKRNNFQFQTHTEKVFKSEIITESFTMNG